MRSFIEDIVDEMGTGSFWTGMWVFALVIALIFGNLPPRGYLIIAVAFVYSMQQEIVYAIRKREE